MQKKNEGTFLSFIPFLLEGWKCYLSVLLVLGTGFGLCGTGSKWQCGLEGQLKQRSVLSFVCGEVPLSHGWKFEGSASPSWSRSRALDGSECVPERGGSAQTLNFSFFLSIFWWALLGTGAPGMLFWCSLALFRSFSLIAQRPQPLLSPRNGYYSPEAVSRQKSI